MATMTVNYIELNVALLNINGLRNKKDEIQDIMTSHQVDVLALCETKLEPSVEDSKVQIPGFSLWRKDRISNGGGVALYTDDHIEAELREDLMIDKVEIIWVELKLADRQSVLVGCCYRPPSNCYKPPLKAGTYLDQLIENIKTVSKEEESILLMGDFNIDWLKDSSDKTKITSVLSECNINQIVREATRDAKNISKCIDHVYGNMLYSGLQVSESGCSDHKLITFTARLKKVIHLRSDNMLNYESFINNIKKAKWTEVYKEICPKEAILKFKKIFFSIVNKHAPREIQVTSDSTMSEPGIKRNRPENYPGPSREFDDNSLEKLKAENDPETLLKILKEIQGERLPPRLNHFNPNRFQTNRLDSVPYSYGINSFSFRRAEPETVETLLECLHLPVLNNTDETEVELIRLAAKQISNPIYYILNRCIESGKGNHRGQSSEMEKRPDSVDAVLSHIFDIVLFIQTKQYFTEQSKQPSASLGYVLQEIHRKCLRDALDNKPVRLLFLDFYPLLHNHCFITKLRSRGFTENAIFLMKTYFSNYRKSICLPRRGFLAGFLFRFILDELEIDSQQLFAVCENHMIIYNNPQKNLQREIESLNKQAKQHEVYINESRIFEINTLRDTLTIFEMLEFVLRSHRDQLNWIKVFKTIVENYRLFNEEFKNILENLNQYFARGSLETCEEFKKSVMNLLVLSHLEN